MQRDETKRFIKEALKYSDYLDQMNKIAREIDCNRENYHSPKWDKLVPQTSRTNSDTMAILIKNEPKSIEYEYLKNKCKWIESTIRKIPAAQIQIMAMDRFIYGMMEKEIAKEYGMTREWVSKSIIAGLNEVINDETWHVYSAIEKKYQAHMEFYSYF